MRASLRQLVRARAGNRCKYCRIEQESEPLSFHVEHVIAEQHEGTDDENNLALACHHCNLLKGPNLAALDPRTGALVRLFNPRLDKWDQHFAECAGEVSGLTDIGRATVKLLKMNEDGRLELRAKQ